MTGQLHRRLSSGRFLLLAWLVALLGMALAGWQVSHFGLTALVLRYGELGLIKRGLLGSLLAPLLPSPLDLGLARALWIGLGVAMGGLLALLATRLRGEPSSGGDGSSGEGSSGVSGSNALDRCALASPALFLQAGYNFSFLDLFSLPLAAAGLLLLLRGGRLPLGASAAALVLLLAAGGLNHEAFFVAFAPLLLLLAWRRRPALAVAGLAACLAVAGLLAARGNYEAGEAALRQALAGAFRQPFAVNSVELTSSAAANLRGTLGALGRGGLLKAAGGFAYLGLLLASLRPVAAAGGAAAAARRLNRLLPLACLTPLLLIPLGTDTSRWLGFAAANLLLLGLAGELRFRLPPLRQSLLLACSLPGPLGIQGSWPLLGKALRLLLPLPA